MYENSSPSGTPLDDYTILLGRDKCLGKGAFGHVTLVQHKTRMQKEAMKVISKKFVQQHGGIQLLQREVTIHRTLVHPNIIKLIDYFEDDKNVYLVMEYAENGNLYRQMQRQGKFTEKESFNIFIQSALGIDFLHHNKTIHRDLKPENLLIDANKKIKLCDFGWSAMSNDQYRTTFCGTIDYMAPEIVNSNAYTYAIDIWSLGILLYELLHGRPPYVGKTEGQKITKIRNGEPITFDGKLSDQVKHLVTNLLTYDQHKRPDMNFIFGHDWVKTYEKVFGINVNSIRNSIKSNSSRSNGFSFGSSAANNDRNSGNVLAKPNLNVNKNNNNFVPANPNGYSGNTAMGNDGFPAFNFTDSAIRQPPKREYVPSNETNGVKRERSPAPMRFRMNDKDSGKGKNENTRSKTWWGGMNIFCCGNRDKN